MANKVTKQYWIFMNGHEDNDYFALLKDVISQMDYTRWCHFHFFRYLDENGHYIRLRVTSSNTEHVKIFKILNKDMAKGQIKKFEQKEYDLYEDIGGRFGISRTDIVVKMIHLTSGLALAYANTKETEPYDPHPNNQGGVAGVVHLICNTLNYRIEAPMGVKVTDWARKQTKKGIGP